MKKSQPLGDVLASLFVPFEVTDLFLPFLFAKKTPKIQAASRKRPRAAKMKNEGAGDSDDERKVGRTDGEGFVGGKILGGVFNDLLFSSLPGEDSHFD